mmetsp:Transcript_65311/g.181162  ORF Transcript_65311/g.181162 Transcript_65311/m.181162 type:complete len:280 (-) Transcript_65311:71-910(-)
MLFDTLQLEHLRSGLPRPGLKLTSDGPEQGLSTCTDSAAQTQYLQQWDPGRFIFQRALPVAKQSSRQVGLYIDGHNSQMVVVKYFSAAARDRGLEAIRRADARGLETAWPEVVLAHRSGHGQGGRPHVVCTCYGAFLDEHGDVLLVTEYIPGGDLLEFTRSLTEPGPARERKAWPVILALLRAVLRLHARGVAHGDVSLENALRRPGPQGEVVLIDFEMAVPGGRRLKTGVSGKASYQAPGGGGGLHASLSTASGTSCSSSAPRSAASTGPSPSASRSA